jgi:hypothetical protein
VTSNSGQEKLELKIYKVKKILGHSNIFTTMRNAHLRQAETLPKAVDVNHGEWQIGRNLPRRTYLRSVGVPGLLALTEN